MPPQLTETWAAAYAQILTMILIFSLGIPVLIVQLSLPQHAKIVIRKLIPKLAFWSLIIFILLTLIGLIWFLHPCTVTCNDFACYLSGCALSIIFIWVCSFSYLLLLGNIVRILEKEVIQNKKRNFSRFNLFNGFRIKEEDDRAFNDLILLGKCSEASYEKNMILDSIDRIITLSSSGIDYSKEITAIADIVATDKIGSDDNFIKALGLFKKLFSIPTMNINDKLLLKEQLLFLCAGAVENKSRKTALQIITSIQHHFRDVQILYRLGVIALNQSKYLTAVRCLSALENMAETVAGIPVGDNASFLLGLDAHFWIHSIGAKKRVNDYFDKTKMSFTPSLHACVEKASEKHLSICEFDTIAALDVMKRDLRLD